MRDRIKGREGECGRNEEGEGEGEGNYDVQTTQRETFLWPFGLL